MAPLRIIALVLLVLAVVLLYFGFHATDQVSERLVEGLTGKYTDGTMKYLIGGALAGAAGLGLLVFGKKS